MTETFIDKVALIYIKKKKLLGTRSHDKDTWYIPGGKREKNESDEQTLIREIKEELSVQIERNTLKHIGTYEAQAHGKPQGTRVRIICYTALFKGEPKASSEIAEIGYFKASDKTLFSEVNQIMIDDLVKRGLL